MTVLTDGDRKILPLARREVRGFHLATRWYLREWTPLPYQYAWHHLPTINTTVVAGIATGKTTMVAASYLIDCITIPYFRALNTSVTQMQAELPFNMAMGWIEGNPRLEHLIEKIDLRPYPVIRFKNYSEWEFRTSGLDARFIRGFEYDRINFDECGLDLVGYISKVLRGRLRGSRLDGTKRMARLDTTTSPTMAVWLKERFDKGWKGSGMEDLVKYRSMRLATWDNTMLTEEQIEAMKAEYPPEMIDVELGGHFPDYGASLFPVGHVNACVDQSMYDAAYIALNPEDPKEKPKPGYEVVEDPRHGITRFELPVQPGRTYVLAGDPGSENYPGRGAAGVMVADVTEKPYKLVYFHWVSGRGSISPFLSSYKYAIEKYSPVLRGIDATGTQKWVDEIAYTNQGIQTDRINFAADKDGMLNNLAYDISNHLWRIPPIKGLIRQAGTYTREDDKKIPQDLVMTWAQLSFLARSAPSPITINSQPKKNNYPSRTGRSRIARSRRW